MWFSWILHLEYCALVSQSVIELRHQQLEYSIHDKWNSEYLDSYSEQCRVTSLWKKRIKLIKVTVLHYNKIPSSLFFSCFTNYKMKWKYQYKMKGYVIL